MSYDLQEVHTPVHGLEYYKNLLLKGISERDEEHVSEWVLHKPVELVTSWGYLMMGSRQKS